MQQGGILDVAQPLPMSKVMVVCPRCDKPDPRPAHQLAVDGQRVRVCRHCGEPLEVARVNRLHERYQDES